MKHLALAAIGGLFLAAGIALLATGDWFGAAAVAFGVMAFVVVLSQRVSDGSGARLEDGALVVRIGRLRRILLVVGALLFTLVSATVTFAGSLFAVLAGVAGVLTFGTFLVVGALQLFGPSQLVLTPAALRWDHGATGPTIPWDEITQVGLWEMHGSNVMAVFVSRPEALPRRFGGRMVARANRNLGAGDVNVPLAQLAVDDDALLALVAGCASTPGARESVATEATLRRLQA
jgi:hypothetical protein